MYLQDASPEHKIGKEKTMLTKKINTNTQPRHLHGFLRWSEDSRTEQREITSLISVGRDPNNMLQLEDDSASRRHCRIQKQENEGFILQDMNSKNGTFLNGSRVFKALLKNNDHIQIGNKEFIFSFERFDQNENIHIKSKNTYWSQQLSTLPNIATNNMPVLITGPSGTGKEILAKLIHRYSHRSKGPMISINCSAVSESLIESEFFGHLKGSYTGALTHRSGAFMAAKGGSLFLDEIGDLSLHLQPKLLRALEYQEIKPVGADRMQKTDVRIIAATHQNLQEKVAKKTFRADLYFRLNVLNLSLPHLKDRMEDFDNLLAFFCTMYNTSFSPSSIRQMKEHSWPGNIRELKNTVARAKALFSNKMIDNKMLPQLISTPISPAEAYMSSEELSEKFSESPSIIKKIEKNMIIENLKKHKGRQSKVAEELNIPKSTLAGRMKKYGINPNHYKK